MNLPAFQFYPGDWLRDPQLRMATPASRGIWFDLLCHMWNAPERGVIIGTADQLQRLASCSADDFSTFLDELDTLKFGDLSRESNGQLRVINRRMVRDEKARKDAAIRQRRHREGNLSRPRHAVVTPLVTGASQQNHNGSSSSSSPSKKETNTDRMSSDFEEIWKERPHREGGDSKRGALRAYRAARNRGIAHEEILGGIKRYKAYCEGKSIVGTSYVMQAARFLGPDEHWRETWKMAEEQAADNRQAIHAAISGIGGM